MARCALMCPSASARRDNPAADVIGEGCDLNQNPVFVLKCTCSTLLGILSCAEIYILACKYCYINHEVYDMFSTIHNSPTVLKHLPTAGFPAFMAAFAIAMVAGSASAYANCERHVYNNSEYVWRMTIENQPSNNLVDYTLQPGESKSYWLVTNSVSKNVWLRQVEGQIGIRKGDEVTYLGTNTMIVISSIT